MKKSLILLIICVSLSACADRERLNCPPVKNKALSGVTNTSTPEPTTPPEYARNGKC